MPGSSSHSISSPDPLVNKVPVIKILLASTVLKTRVRTIRDELVVVSGTALAETAARLGANVLVSVWSVAVVDAHRSFGRDRSSEEAQRVFLAIVGQGSARLKAMMAGTPYA